MMTGLVVDGRPLPIALADQRAAATDNARLLLWAVYEHLHAELSLLERRSDRQSERIGWLRAQLREKAVVA
jgi:hypothetical protein